MSKKEIDSLIKLLDDPDEEVFNSVKNKLYGEGVSIIRKLEASWELTDNPIVQKRIEQLSHDIHFRFIHNELQKWLKSDEKDLLYPLLLISKFHFPDIDINQYTSRFLSIATEVEAELTPGLTPLEQIKVIDHILFQEHKLVRTFTGLKKTESFLLSNLITSNKGNLLILAIFYMLIGQKLQLPVYGLNLPDNFAVAFVNPNTSKDYLDKHDVLFYINPGNKGAVFSKTEIDDFLKRIGRQKSDAYYTPVYNRTALEVYMSNLLKSYKHNGNSEKSKELSILLKLVKQAL